MSVTFFEQWYAGSLKIRGYEPVSASGLPVYVYFSGTGTSNTRTAELEFPRQMALRDYVGAWVEYPNHASYPTSCAGVRGKMATVRQGIQAVCDRPKADCSRGIAVHGFSQGAHIATLAAEYHSSVSAALLFGHGHYNWGALSNFACFYASNVNPHLPKHKRRHLTAENDPYFGIVASGVRQQLKIVSGYGCGNKNVCFDESGAGYRVVTASSLGGINLFGFPGHCFFLTAWYAPRRHEPPPFHPHCASERRASWSQHLRRVAIEVAQ